MVILIPLNPKRCPAAADTEIESAGCAVQHRKNRWGKTVVVLVVPVEVRVLDGTKPCNKVDRLHGKRDRRKRLQGQRSGFLSPPSRPDCIKRSLHRVNETRCSKNSIRIADLACPSLNEEIERG